MTSHSWLSLFELQKTMGSGKKNIELVVHLGIPANKWLRTVVEPTDW